MLLMKDVASGLRLQVHEDRLYLKMQIGLFRTLRWLNVLLHPALLLKSDLKLWFVRQNSNNFTFQTFFLGSPSRLSNAYRGKAGIRMYYALCVVDKKL